jgi:hypothetical protein
MGWIAWRSSSVFQPASCCVVQSPYARLIVGVPSDAISSSRAVASLAVALSASISTASRAVLVVATRASSRDRAVNGPVRAQQEP